MWVAQKSTPATADDLAVAQDLLDTLTFHKDGCVGNRRDKHGRIHFVNG